jgi:hypothetical protein
MSSKTYIEDERIVLPILKDGVTRLGDLWDCNKSESIGENLFEDYLDGEYINVSPIDSLDYQLIHNKSTSDLIKSVKVEGEISLEFLTGLIKVKGSNDYNSNQNESTCREQLICHYQRNTFSVDAHTKSKDILNKTIFEKIMKNELKVTHFVRGIILGSEVRADIVLTRSETNNKTDVKGDFLVPIKYGPINASVKASLNYLDNVDR